MRISFRLNHNLMVNNGCTYPDSSFGAFAAVSLPTGLRIYSETTVLLYDSRNDAYQQFHHDFKQIPEYLKGYFVTLFAGSGDICLTLPASDMRDMQMVATGRLQSIVRYNSIEGQGVGCALGLAISALNHRSVRYLHNLRVVHGL